jgi:hypothetical protein
MTTRRTLSRMTQKTERQEKDFMALGNTASDGLLHPSSTASIEHLAERLYEQIVSNRWDDRVNPMGELAGEKVALIVACIERVQAMALRDAALLWIAGDGLKTNYGTVKAVLRERAKQLEAGLEPKSRDRSAGIQSTHAGTVDAPAGRSGPVSRIARRGDR